MENTNRTKLITELIDYFISQDFSIIAARKVPGYRSPEPLYNDGYGDQRNKQPDVIAYDPHMKCHVIGIVRLSKEELANEESLTEYNVFLDQHDSKTRKPYRLYILVPEDCVNDITSIITHYIHREYWHRVMIVASGCSSRNISQDS